jgi:hypothetical protein
MNGINSFAKMVLPDSITSVSFSYFFDESTSKKLYNGSQHLFIFSLLIRAAG